MRTIYAIYSVSDDFKVPKSIPLLSVEENSKIKEPTAWSWGVKWGTLYYYDADLKEQELQPEFSASDSDFKRPDAFEEDDDAEEEDAYEDDHLNLQLNYGLCLLEGRHEKTTDEEWKIFVDMGSYSKERYEMLTNHLMKRDGKVNSKDE